jgi:hypothetical protein
MHSERREVNARQPDNPRCHGLAKGDAPRKGKVDGQPHLTSTSLNAYCVFRIEEKIFSYPIVKYASGVST